MDRRFRICGGVCAHDHSYMHDRCDGDNPFVLGPCIVSAVEEALQMAGESFPLDAPVYQMNEAARLLELPDKTLRRWIDGGRRFAG